MTDTQTPPVQEQNPTALTVDGPGFEPGMTEDDDAGGQLGLGFDDLMVEGDPAAAQDEADASKTAEGSPAPGEGQASDEGGASEDASQASSPVTDDTLVQVGDQQVPISDLRSAFESQVEAKGLIEYGQTYAGALKTFNSSPEGAKAVIQSMIDAAVQVHGPDIEVSEASLSALNPDSMTETERTLYAINRRTQAELDRVRGEFHQALEELKPIATEKRLKDLSSGYAAQVNQQYPDASVSPEEIANMMRETGLDDPIKAYKLASFDTVRGAKKTEEHQEKQADKPNIPRGGSKTFSTKGLSVDQIASKMRAGLVPINES
jgi:hypothetical protein